VTPLKPNIKCQVIIHLTVCNCCGIEDGTIKQLVLGWEEHRVRSAQGGATSVSLCAGCRVLVAKALEPS
jgi:hypothetical protein